MTVDRLRRLAPYLLHAVIAGWYCWPLFELPDGLGGHDWDQHLFYYGSVIKSVAEYGALPFWNPWYCGGNVLWQNPQVPLLSPVFPLVTVMSLPLAMKVNIVLHYWIGLVGMHLLLTRALGVRSWAAAAFLSVTGALSGAMAMHLAVGHSVFLPVLYLPLQLHFLVRAIRTDSWRAALLAAVPLALMVYNGALHAVPMSVAAVGIFGAVATVALRRWRPVLLATFVVAMGLALSAPKLLPVTLFVTSDRFVDARTTIPHPDAMSGEMLLRTYLDRYQDRGLTFDNQRSGWYEYGNYVGGMAAILMASAVVWALLGGGGARDRWLGVALAITALAFLALSAGEFASWAPASLAHYVPLFSSFRIPSRYTFGAVLFGAATAGWAVGALLDGGRPTGRAVAFVTVAALLGSADIALQTRQQLVGVFAGAPLERGFRWRGGVNDPTVDATSDPYRSGSPMLHALMEDRLFFRCYESLQLKRTATADAPMTSGSAETRLFETRFSPNRVDVSVTSAGPQPQLSLNQNVADGWTSSAGSLAAVPGRPGMTLMLPPGAAGRFTFRFVPPGLYAGCAIAAVALLAGLAAARLDRRALTP